MRKFVCLILSLLLLATVLWGCASEAKMEHENSDAMERVNYSEGFYAAATVAPESEVAFETETSVAVADNRKLIRKLSLSAETENYDELMAQIERQTFLCDGYIENMEASTRYSSKRYANLTIRVPADRLDEFAGYVGEMSNIVYRSESCTDITTTYVDTHSRRDALQTEYDRLLELLAQAKSLDEILQIENRLTDVRYELQNIESQLRTYDNLVDYATVTLDITEVQVYTVIETEEKGFWETLSDGFVDTLREIWDFITACFAFLIIKLPYLLLICIPVVLLCLFCRRKRKCPPQDPK